MAYYSTDPDEQRRRALGMMLMAGSAASTTGSNPWQSFSRGLGAASLANMRYQAGLQEWLENQRVVEEEQRRNQMIAGLGQRIAGSDMPIARPGDTRPGGMNLAAPDWSSDPRWQNVIDPALSSGDPSLIASMLGPAMNVMTPPKPGDQWRQMTAEEMAQAGYRPGTIGYVNMKNGDVQIEQRPLNEMSGGEGYDPYDPAAVLRRMVAERLAERSSGDGTETSDTETPAEPGGDWWNPLDWFRGGDETPPTGTPMQEFDLSPAPDEGGEGTDPLLRDMKAMQAQRPSFVPSDTLAARAQEGLAGASGALAGSMPPAMRREIANRIIKKYRRMKR